MNNSPLPPPKKMVARKVAGWARLRKGQTDGAFSADGLGVAPPLGLWTPTSMVSTSGCVGFARDPHSYPAPILASMHPPPASPSPHTAPRLPLAPVLTGKILVHCAVGVSRSATLVLAYLMLYHHLTLVEAIKKVKDHRGIIPNRGFLRQLLALDRRLRQGLEA